MSRKANSLFYGALAVSAGAHLMLLLLSPSVRSAPPQPPAAEIYSVSLLRQPQPEPAAPIFRAAPAGAAAVRPAILSGPPPAPSRQPDEASPALPAVPAVSVPAELPPDQVSATLLAESGAAEQAEAVPEAAIDSTAGIGVSGDSGTAVASGETSSAAVPASLAQEAGAWSAEARLIAELRSRIQGQIRYPPQARSRGWKGTVLLLASLDAQGRLQELRVRKSSGHSVLDQAAAALVRKVTPIENAAGRPLAIEIPIVYELKD
jgi:protein TonB